MDPLSVIERMRTYLLDENKAAIDEAWMVTLLHGGCMLQMDESGKLSVIKPSEPEA